MGKFWDWLSGESNRRKLFKNDKATDGLTVRGIYDDLVGNSQIDKTLSAQSKENALTRDYNLNLAKMQNSWNIEQWHRENQYNSPAAQAARLQAAGLNTDMMYGQGGISNVSASSPSMSSGAPATPQDWSSLAGKKTIGGVLSDTLAMEMMRAQIDKTKEESKNTGAQTDLLVNELAFKEAYNKGLLELQNVQINLGNSNIKLNDENVKRVQAEVAKLNNECSVLIKSLDQMTASISNMEADTALKKVEAACREKLTDSELKSMAARRGVDYETAKRMRQELPYIITQYQDNKGITMEQGAILKKEGQLLQIQIDEASNHPRNSGGMWTHIYKGVQFVDDLVDAISPFIGPVASSAKGKR